jgi:hypothetical protein
MNQGPHLTNLDRIGTQPRNAKLLRGTVRRDFFENISARPRIERISTEENRVFLIEMHLVHEGFKN